MCQLSRSFLKAKPHEAWQPLFETTCGPPCFGFVVFTACDLPHSAVQATHLAPDWMFTPDQLKKLSLQPYFTLVDKMVFLFDGRFKLCGWGWIVSLFCSHNEFGICTINGYKRTKDIQFEGSTITVWPSFRQPLASLYKLVKNVLSTPTNRMCLKLCNAFSALRQKKLRMCHTQRIQSYIKIAGLPAGARHHVT